MPKRGSAIVGKAVTREIPSPAGEVSLVTFIPWTLVKRGVKKEIITPLDAPVQFQEESDEERQRKKLDGKQVSALVKALGLAHHWRQLLESGKVGSVTDLAEREGVSKQHVSLTLRVTQLAPEIVESLLNGAAPKRLTLDYFKRNPVPLSWEAQKVMMANLA